jgi:hypothetical protein
VVVYVVGLCLVCMLPRSVLSNDMDSSVSRGKEVVQRVLW